MVWLLAATVSLPEATAVIESETGGNLLVTVFVLLGIVALVIALFSIFRWAMNNTMLIPMAFRRKVLMISVPKEHMELQEQQDKHKGNVKELIAVAEALYANLGGIVRMQKWYSRLLYGRHDHLALEIVADKGFVSFIVAIPFQYHEFIEQQIHAQYPEAHVEAMEDYNIFSSHGVIKMNNLKLSRSNMYPIRTYQKLEVDPMNAITNVLSKITEPEGAAIQILFRRAGRGWQHAAHSYARKVIQGKGGQAGSGAMMGDLWHSAFPSKMQDQNEQQKKNFYKLSPIEEGKMKAVSEKAEKIGFEVNLRVIVSAGDADRAKIYMDNILNSFTQYTAHETGNSFRKAKVYLKHRFIHDFIFRNFRRRNSFILNTEELTSLWHLPLSDTETPNIRWAAAKRSAPPVDLPNEGLILGQSSYRGRDLLVRIKKDDRRRHVYIIGKSGVGKSVLMTNMAVQDIKNGEGVCVVDPHGDLIEDILGQIPKERSDDVIIFDPSDTERPVGLNMLEAQTPMDRDFAVQEMISIFYKLFPPEMIGPMFEHNMRNVMLTLMADTVQPGTIVEIPRMFTDPEYQKFKLRKVTDPVVRNFWEKEMAKTTDFHKSEMLGYLISKVGRFVENEMMRNIIGQSRSGFDFEEIMNKRKILLVNLSKGKTGEVNSSLLGLIIVSKLQMAALHRANLPSEERHDFYLYIDEFQNFVTDSVATILSEARKYRLNLIIAHQYINQLVQNNDTKIRDAVLGNAGTIISFKVGVEDSQMVSKIYAPVFNEFDVMNIEKYNAYVKLLIDNQTGRAFNMQTVAPLPGDRALAQRIKELSRLKHGREKKVVETEIMERSQLGAPAARLGDTVGERHM